MLNKRGSKLAGQGGWTWEYLRRGRGELIEGQCQLLGVVKHLRLRTANHTLKFSPQKASFNRIPRD